MALRRVFRAFVCAYRGMDGKFYRAKKPIVVFWAKSSGVLAGRDDVHGVVLGRDGTRSVRRVRRARQRRGKSDVRIVCVGQVFVRIVPCAVFRGKNSLAWTCHNDCHFGVNVDFLYFYSAIPRGETCKSRRSRPAFMVFVSVVAVLRRRDYKLKKGRRRPPSRKNGAFMYYLHPPPPPHPQQQHKITSHGQKPYAPPPHPQPSLQPPPHPPQQQRRIRIHNIQSQPEPPPKKFPFIAQPPFHTR